MVGWVLICGEPIFGRGVAGCQVWVPANIPPILLVTQIIAVSPLFATSKPFPPFLGLEFLLRLSILTLW